MSERTLLRKAKSPGVANNFRKLKQAIAKKTAEPWSNGNLVSVTPSGDSIIKVDHGLERPFTGFFSTTGHPLVVHRNNPVPDKQIWLKSAVPWFFIDEQVFSADFSFTGLDSSKQRAYHWEVDWEATGTAAINLEPNGLTTNQETSWFTVENSAYTDGTTTTLRVGYSSYANSTNSTKGYLYALPGSDRQIVWESIADAGTNLSARYGQCHWNATTNIEYLTFNFTNTVSGTARLYQRGLGGQKINLWVF